jgi:hypothetical protein
MMSSKSSFINIHTVELYSSSVIIITKSRTRLRARKLQKWREREPPKY